LPAHGRWFSLASSTTKTGRHGIAEILLKVALTTINQINQLPCYSDVIFTSVTWNCFFASLRMPRPHICTVSKFVFISFVTLIKFAWGFIFLLLSSTTYLRCKLHVAPRPIIRCITFSVWRISQPINLHFCVSGKEYPVYNN
jgi:hypothetical protein